MFTGLHHLVLFCGDTDASRAWYEQVGFRYLRGDRGMHWFQLGDAEIMLHPGGAGPGPGAPHLHAAVTDVAALFRHVVELGLQPQDHQANPGQVLTGPVRRPWGHLEFELPDPDGHHWVFTQA